MFHSTWDIHLERRLEQSPLLCSIIITRNAHTFGFALAKACMPTCYAQVFGQQLFRTLFRKKRVAFAKVLAILSDPFSQKK